MSVCCWFFFVSTRYHSNACYKLYLLRADRKEKGETKIDLEIDTTEAENDYIIHSTPRLKRKKSDDSTVTKCIICDKQYHNKRKKNVPSL